MSAIRALAEQLARRSDDELRWLLSVRPDLVLPPVPDFAALSARASTRVSVQRALDNLSRPHLQLLEVLVVLDEEYPEPVTGDGLAGAFATGDPEALAELLAELVRRALVVVTDSGALLPVGALADALGPYPAGLGRPFRSLARTVPGFGAALVQALENLEPDAAAPFTSASAAGALELRTGDPAAWQDLLSDAPGEAVALLSRLRDSPVGSTATGDGPAVTPAARWLLDRCLLAPLDALHVELPRGVGRALRGGAVFASLEQRPSAPPERTTRRSLRDNAAFGAIAETLRMITALLALAASTPVATLRSGGVGVRELRRVREALRCTDAEAAWLLELAAAVGLLTLDPDDSRWKVLRPDAWEALERDAQWLLLVEGWLGVDRAPALVGTRLPDGASINALAAEASRPDAPLVRTRLLSVAVELTEGVRTPSSGGRTGTGPDAGGGSGAQTTAAGVTTGDSSPGAAAPGNPAGGTALPVLTEEVAVALASWHQPRLHRRFARLLPGMLTEAAALGLLGGGALTDAGRSIAEGRFEEAAQHIRDALPAPVSQVVLQADLTAVAPGYLQPEVARGLARLAVAEGQGPATTFRFSADSLRSALNAGEDAASILAFLREHSATEIPQALSYLIEDTAARHDAVRIGRAGSYLRTEDDAVIGAVLADPRAGALGILQLAPTVLVSQASAKELATLLRDLGFAAASDAVVPPAPGGTTGPPGESVPVAPRDALRSRLNPWSVAEEEITAQLAVLRSDRQAQVDGTAADGETLLGLESLRSAIRSRSRIRLGTADSEGNHLRQILVPLSVSGGRLRVFDPEKQVERTVSVHRVMDVEILEGSPADD